jgi:hypothetical protein
MKFPRLELSEWAVIAALIACVILVVWKVTHA